jgi:hypothetical protein
MPTVDLNDWLEKFSEADLEQYQLDHPDAEYAFFVPEGIIVLGAATPQVKSSLWPILQENGLAPFVEIHDGEARFFPFQLAADDPRHAAPSDRHTGPGQIALHFPGALIPITPETRVQVQGVSSRTDLHEVDADSLAALMRHNRKEADAERTAQQQQEYHPLKTYGLKADVIKSQMTDATEVLPGIALRGQSTVIFAPPNTGKTLLILFLLIQAIKAGMLEPHHVFYVNVDDNVNGLYEKVLLAEKHRFNMLAEGFEGFTAKLLLGKLKGLIETGFATKTVVILDTLKRFTDVMDKRANAEFTGVMREFAIKGGTIIQLGHTNKNRGANGKSTFAGTSDLVDDVDCAFMLEEVKVDRSAERKIVEFQRLKSRGQVAERVAFSYSIAEGLTYPELLASVEEVDPANLEAVHRELSVEADKAVISAIEACIKEGTNAKMQIVAQAARRAKVSQRAVAGVLDRYTGEHPGDHRWTYTIGERGAKLFALLTVPTEPPAGD